MNKVYRISHNISACLKMFQNESQRYFSDIESANDVFEILLAKIDYNNDEWISLSEMEVECEYGEFKMKEMNMLRYFSDDTKIGVKFDVMNIKGNQNGNTCKRKWRQS